jgi:hypothetical protein
MYSEQRQQLRDAHRKLFGRDPDACHPPHPLAGSWSDPPDAPWRESVAESHAVFRLESIGGGDSIDLVPVPERAPPSRLPNVATAWHAYVATQFTVHDIRAPVGQARPSRDWGLISGCGE